MSPLFKYRLGATVLKCWEDNGRQYNFFKDEHSNSVTQGRVELWSSVYM